MCCFFFLSGRALVWHGVVWALGGRRDETNCVWDSAHCFISTLLFAYRTTVKTSLSSSVLGTGAGDSTLANR